MRHSPDRLTLIPRLGLCLALALTSLSAQQGSQPPAPPPAAAPPPQAPPPRFTTEANYVRVDAYPTRDGKPVEDLRAEDFEITENGVRQRVQAFEHVVISPAGPQSLRVEANSVRGGEQMAANPRNRVFVIFLDVPGVPVEGSHRIKEPLIRLIDRILGPDDLIAVMTPEMSAAQITFGRKTEVIADMLREKWTWGIRHSIVVMDQREAEYERCFPPTMDESKQGTTTSALGRRLIERRRERIVLDALHDLVRYLGGVREERKAILAVTSGWLLHRPDPSLLNVRVMDAKTGDTEPVPGNEPIGVDPVGKLRVGAARSREGDAVSQTSCDRERMHLASIDNEDHFRYLMDMANRHNASFYPIEPRGLMVFDSPIGPDAPAPITVDMARVTHRVEMLRTLAENTDGMAVVNTNDLDRGLRRMADDLTSYYLLGYYSTNAKPDGQYRRIGVRVTRPGVEVRARRGYRAATAAEVNASRTAAAAPVPDHVRTATAALARLGRIRPEQRFSIYAVPVSAAAGSGGVWIAGELQGPPQEFAAGAVAAIELTGGASGTASATLKPGERAFLVRLPIEGAATTPIEVRVRLSPAGGATPLSDVVRLDLDAAPVQPLIFKRGLSTGNRLQPAAGFQFSRTDRLRLELPITATATPGTGRFLDRNGQPLQIPVQVGERQDPDGQRWLTADATLSALAAGDYVIDVSFTVAGTERRVVTAVRVTR